jgi:superfamily II RNA helicase
MLQNVASRHCRNCDTTKEIQYFYPSYKSRCKDCLKAQAAPQQEDKKRYLAEWRAKNPDAAKKWYQENKEHRYQYNAEYYAQDREQQLARRAAWAKDNPGKVNALISKRTHRINNQTPPWANLDAIREIYERAATLTQETGIKHHVDHMIPIQGKTVCGLHWEGNLQILTATENQKKSNRLLVGEAYE